MNAQINGIYDEANRLFTSAKALMDEYKGKDMPQEKAVELDSLLDQVEAKKDQATKLENEVKRADRLADNDKFFNDPATRKELFQKDEKGGGSGEVKVKFAGRELDPDEVAELKAISPHAGFIAAFNPAYKNAFNAYMRKGLMGMTAEQIKALSVGDPQAGGYLSQDTYLNELITKQREASAMRRISRVLPPLPSGSAIAPTEESFLSDATWSSEVATGSEDSVRPFGDRRLTPKVLAKLIKVSNTLLRNPFFDVEGWTRDHLAYKFATPEEGAFINGDGVNKPLGLLQTVGLPIFTTATSVQVYGDDVINWIYKLPQGYATRPTTRILANRSFIRKLRTVSKKDTSTSFTNYIWQPGLAAGVPNTILDVPYELSDQYPTGLDGSDAWTANSLVAVVGDFSYFWIVDALQLTIQRLVERYAETNQTGFIGRKESDGMCVLPEAFYALKVKA